MKLKIEPIVLFRVPKFALSATLAKSWEELKQSIAEASPEFYNLIKDKTVEELKMIPENIRFTIWKYFNRSKYRATPFGSFAGFGLCETRSSGGYTSIIVDDKQIIHEFTDWSSSEISFEPKQILEENYRLIANSTYYISASHLRYIAANASGFELCEERADDLAKEILVESGSGIRSRELIERLIHKGFARELVSTKLEEMIELQLLLSEAEPNIIGQDFFKRLNIAHAANPSKYLIAEYQYKYGSVNEEAIKNLPRLMNFLQASVPQPESEALGQFMQSFLQKFEQREVPLMLALDPEIGIGYDGLEQAMDNDEFVARFTGRTATKNTQTALKDQLIKKLFKGNGDAHSIIQLEDLLDQSLQYPLPYPNSLNAIVSVADDLLCLEYLGGCTANALLGRFTLASERLHSWCKTIAEMEAAANPGVLFFDLAYMSEGYVDNINRRQSIYPYQLSILNYDTSERPLPLSDILVSVRSGKLVLRSGSLGKRLVPRMASAYNYSRSDLPVFRLLCDLQFQGLHSHPLIRIENVLPGLPSYPRVMYKNIIVSPAKWNIEKETIRKWKQSDDGIAVCRQDLTSLGVSIYFKVGASDQTLRFDTASDADLAALIQYSSKYDNILLKEVMVSQTSSVKNAKGDSYHAEFILSLTHHEQIYHGIHDTFTGKPNDVCTNSIIPPGNEWLYFEIYCHEQRTETIILQYIKDFVSGYSADIRHWFFIRFNEGGNHIRLRIRLFDATRGQTLTNALSNLLHEDINSGLISQLLIKTYKRETERYHPETIERVEEHFYQDSKFVLSLLESGPEVLQLYRWCSRTIDKIADSGIFSAVEMKHIVDTVTSSLNNEHQITNKDFKVLNERYREFADTILPSPSAKQNEHYTKFCESFISILSVSKMERRPKLFIDLMHMHVNRLFSSKQRTHEMVIYAFALKDIKRLMVHSAIINKSS